MLSTIQPPATSTRQWGVVVLLFLAVLINYIDRGNLSIVAVPLMKDFGISPASMGTLLSAFFWTYSLMQIPVGWLVDRFGLRWTYAVAFLVWSLASAAVGLSSSFTQVLLFRLLLGVGESVAQPASLAYIRQNFREDQRGLPTGIYLSGMMIGPAVGAFFGAVLLEQLGWRELFIYTGLGGCLWLLPWLWMVSAGGRAVASATTRAQRTDWLRLLRSPAFWALTIGPFFYSYYWYFCLTWVPSYLVLQYQMSFLKMGTYTAIPMLGMAAVSTVAAKVADRRIARGGNPVRVRRTFACTGFVVGASGLGLVWVTTAEGALAVLICSLLGLGLAGANYWALTQAISPASMIGRVVGYQNTVSNLAGVCAPILTGYLIGDTKDFRLAIWAAGLSLIVAAITYSTLIRESAPAEFAAAVEG